MKQRFRMYQRGINGRFYLQDNTTGKQESLGTNDCTDAERFASVPFRALNPSETVRNANSDPPLVDQ